MIRESLMGEGWRVRECGGAQTYHVSAPCSVLSVLMDEGVLPDLYDGENEALALPHLEKDYEFERIVSVGGEIMQEDVIELVFHGLDTVTEIYLNNERIARTRNMHRAYRISVKDKLHMGANELKIVFHSPLKYIRDYKPGEHKEISYAPCGALPGGQYLRKVHSSFGWDWGPQLPDMGIFREIALETYAKVHINEVRFFQEHDRGRIRLFVDPLLEYSDVIPVELTVEVSGEEPVSVMTRMPADGSMRTAPGENEFQIPIHDPQLWWPNGLGDQPLYEVRIKAHKADKIYDERVYRIGLRTLSVSREKDEYGEEFCFVVNGVKIFAMGADYIPEDAITPRLSREKTAMLVNSARAANFNCLRVWGGGYYPSDDFYDLCDEAGIIVWQDLMFACNVYELTSSFEKSIIAETRDNVMRLRHHACLGLWCGNNENESAWTNWEEFQKQSPALRADYIKMFEHILPRAVAECDDQTFYWPSSPSSGGCFDAPEDENRGDSHYWGVWHGLKPFTEFRNHYFRFLSEFGFQSFPALKTVKTFTQPEDRNIFSPVMESHQKNAQANGRILSYISENFRYPKNFEQLIYVSQILQGLAIQSGVEHFRRNRGRCMGTLYWQMNDNWPVASWSGIDYYGRWKALHYMAKHFYAPVAVSINCEGHKVTPYLVNDGMTDTVARLKLSVMTMEGRVISSFTEEGKCPAGEVHRFLTRDLEKQLRDFSEREVYLYAEFSYDDNALSKTAVLVPHKKLKLIREEPEVTIKDAGEYYEITLLSESYMPFVFLDLKDADVIFSDNVIDLNHGMPVTVRAYKADISGAEIENAENFQEQLVVYTLQGSYV